MNRRHLLRHRLISALLTAVLVLGLMPVSVFAEQVPPVTAPDVSTQPQSADASEAGFTIWTEPVFASTFDPAQEPLIASYANSVYTGSYRDQLSELEQAAYDYVVSNPVITTAESQKNPVKLSVQAQAVLIAGSDGKPTIDYQNVPEYRALIESLQKAAYAVCYDYPMYSWILNGAFSAGVLVSYPGGSQIGDTITITFTGAYYDFKKPSYYDQISSVDQKIAEIVAKVDKSAPRKDQLKTLHDEVCRLTDYNYDAVKQDPSLNGDWLYAWSPYGTFTGQKVVCEGYARAFKMLCDALSIPCALISGSGNGEAHMWNAVQMEDGKWYGVDVTWDDGSAISYTYFLKPSADFTDHIPQPHLQLVYPVLSDTEYVGQKPTLSVTSNASDWTKEDVTLVVKVANFASGVQCFYQLPSASEQAVSLDASGNGKVTVSQEMNGNIVFTLKDSGGNQLGSQQVAVKVDRTNPVISNVTLTDTGTPLSARIATKNQVRVSATVTDSASGVKTVQAAVGSDVYPMEKSGDTYSVVIDREYAAQTVKVTAQDAVGNTAENSAGESVTTDKTPPSIAQLSVKEGSVSANAATISAALGENATLYYLVQPASQAAPDAQAILTGGQSASVGTNAVELSVDALAPNTAYVVYAVAQDAVGNVCGVTTVSFQTQKEALRFTGSLTAKGTYGVTWNELNITASAGVTTQDGSVVSGTWRWTNVPADLPETTIQQASATFVPDKNAENYDTLTADAAITIAKAQADQGMKTANGLIVAGVPGSAVLPALPKGASYGAPATTDSQVLKLAVNGTQLTYEGSADVAEGTSYTVTVPVTGAVNYEDYTITVTLLGTSKKVPSGQPALSADTLTYGEPLSTITLTGTMTSEGAQVPGSFAWETPDAMPSAGTFQANWIFTPENTNLYEQVKGTASIEVARKELTVRVASVEEKVFDGTTTAKGTLTLEGAVKGEKPTATGDFAWTSAAAGTSTVNITNIVLADSWAANYTVPASLTAQDALTSIQPKALTAAAFDALASTVYTGKEQTPALTVLDALLTNDDYQVSYQNNLNAGTAAVTVTGQGNFTGTVSLSFEIEPASLSYSIADQTVKIGNGTADLSAQKTASGVNNETVNGALAFYADAAYTEVLPTDYTFKGAEGDKVTLYWTFTPDSSATNYRSDVLKGSVVLTLAEKEVPVLTAASFTKTYDGQTVAVEQLTQNATAKDSKGTNIEGTWSLDGATPALKDSGTYSVTLHFAPKDTKNYVGASIAVSVRIDPRPITVYPQLSTNRITVSENIPSVSLVYANIVSGESFALKTEPIFNGLPPKGQAGEFYVLWANQAAMKAEMEALDMAKNYVISYANTVKLTVVNAQLQPGSTSASRVEIANGLTRVPDGLANTAFNTVDKVFAEMVRVAAQILKGATQNNTVLYDVTWVISNDNGVTWREAQAQDFQNNSGLTVLLPYPTGTNATGFDFVVTHMLTQDGGGRRAGEVEMPQVTKTENGLQFTLTSLSPVAISWTAKTTSGGDTSQPTTPPTTTPPTTTTPATTPSTSGTTSTVIAQTDDASNVALWMTVLALSGVLGTALFVWERKSRKENL